MRLISEVGRLDYPVSMKKGPKLDTQLKKADDTSCLWNLISASMNRNWLLNNLTMEITEYMHKILTLKQWNGMETNSPNLLILTEDLVIYTALDNSQNARISNFFLSVPVWKYFFTWTFNNANCIYKSGFMELEYFLHKATISPLEDLGAEV